jgi:hypothetical protein
LTKEIVMTDRVRALLGKAWAFVTGRLVPEIRSMIADVRAFTLDRGAKHG